MLCLGFFAAQAAAPGDTADTRAVGIREAAGILGAEAEAVAAVVGVAVEVEAVVRVAVADIRGSGDSLEVADP